MSILTSSSQYLQPEFLCATTPNQLDAKKSPLALLAATCNSIGNDSPNSQTLIPSLEKDRKCNDSDVNDGRNSSTSSVGSFRSMSPHSDKNKHYKSNHSSPKRDVTDFMDVCKSPRHIASDLQLKLGKDYSRSRSVSPKDKPRESARSNAIHSNYKTPSSNELHLSTATTTVSSTHTNPYGHDKKESSLPLSSLGPYSAHLPLSGLNPLSGYPFSHLGSSAALLAAHKHSAESMKYTTVRTASGGTTLVPMCTDPYCAHCKLTVHAAQLSTANCSAGCVQCTHDKGVGLPPSYPHAAALSAGLLGLPGLGGLPGISHPAGSLFGTAAVNGHNGAQPYVCSWMSSTGSGVCGKRFTSSEELMQHLRTHTSSLDSSALHSGLSYPSLPTPGAFSSSLLRHAYGGRLSPGLLSASRFHPYLKSLSTLPGSEGVLPPVHPSLGAYSSLYSLYGHKLGVP